MLKDPPSNPLRNLVHSLLQLSSNSLSLQCLDSVRVGSSRHNDECDNGSLGSSFLESGIESWLSATDDREAERPRHFATKRRMWVCGTYRQGGKSEREVGSGLTSKRLDKHINTFIPKLVSTSSEQVERVVQIEIVMTIEMTSDKVVNLLLGLDVEVLEFVHGSELLDVETIGEDTIW
jgi:hypothetical protein